MRTGNAAETDGITEAKARDRDLDVAVVSDERGHLGLTLEKIPTARSPGMVSIPAPPSIAIPVSTECSPAAATASRAVSGHGR